MIPLTLTQALGLYAGVLGVMVVGIWLYTELRVRRPQRGLGQQFLWHCVICGYSFLDDENTELAECPQCGTILSARDKGTREVMVVDGKVEAAPAIGPDEDPRRNPSKRKRPNASRRGPRRRGRR